MNPDKLCRACGQSFFARYWKGAPPHRCPAVEPYRALITGRNARAKQYQRGAENIAKRAAHLLFQERDDAGMIPKTPLAPVRCLSYRARLWEEYGQARAPSRAA